MDPGPPRLPPETSAGGVFASPTARRLAAILAAALAAATILAGCAAPDAARVPGRDGGAGETPEPSPRPPSDAAEDEPAGSGDGFVLSGEFGGGTAGAADRIEGVRFRIFDGHERLTVGFRREDGAAGVPRWSVERGEGGGYVRVRLPGVSSTRVAHEDVVGSALDEIYVVHAREGGLFVDVFATHGFRYRARALPGSGRLAIDFRGVSEEMRLPPTTGDGAVVLRPREAEEVGGPLAIRGYARPSAGRLTLSLFDRGRDLLATQKVGIGDPEGPAWVPFEATLEPSGYEGLATLRVGGAETEVFLEGPGPG